MSRLVGGLILFLSLVASATADATTLTKFDCALHDVLSRPSNRSKNSPLLCGEETWLRVQATMPKPANVTLSTTTTNNLPIPLVPKAPSCTIRDDLNLPIVGSQLLAIKDMDNQWVVEVNCTFPSDLDADDFKWTKDETQVGLICVFRVGGQDVNLDVSLPTFVYLDSDYDVKGLTLLNKPPPPKEDDTHPSATVTPTNRRQLATIATPLLGIGQVAMFRVDVTGPNAAARVASLTGSCLINKSNVTVVNGHVNYTVTRGDSDLVGLKFQCNVVDGAGNSPSRSAGSIQHLVLQIDGTVPAIEDELFMLFSTDKPARIGSVISLTLKAVHLTQGYSGVCTVNGVKGVALLEAEDHGFYMIQYTVAEGDNSLEDMAVMPLRCVVRNRAGNTFEFKHDVELGFAIDAVRPKVLSTSLLFSSDRPAHEGTIIEIQVAFANEQPHLRVAKNDSCLVNNVSVGASFSQSSSRAFLFTYVVGKGEAMWKAGALPIRCTVQDAAGNTALIDRFTDGNTLMARELKPIEMDADEVISTEFLPDKLLIISFIIVAIASHSISKVCPHIGLPRITGYIVTGILVGPYVLNFLTTHQIRQLRIIDELSMAYIGLTAGSKLHWNQMKPIMRSILFITVGLTLVEYIIGTLTIAVLAGYIDFLQDTSESEKYAIALLAGCMMIARSPSSALAVIEETKSQGHFTTLIFAVTVMCDVLVIFLFNVNSMITESFLSEKTMGMSDVLKLVLQLCGSMCVGCVLGKVMGWIVFWRPRAIKRKSVWFKCQQISKQFLILLYGWMIFVICHLAHPYLEPLLCCMVSGAVMWNSSANPEELSMLLKQLADLVYVSFFTITGATLELDMLVKAMALSIVLCLTRVIGIFLGSFVGGIAAGEDRGHCNVAWMAYITQAGVTLGLAKQIQLMYPGWGSYFSTMIVAVVICNQLLGPPMLRYVLRFVGDAKKKEMGKVDGLTAVVFMGNHSKNHQSAVMRLEVCGWNVHTHAIEALLEEKKEADYVEDVAQDVLHVLQAVKPIEVVVVMMPTDQESYHVIRALANTCQKLRRIRVMRVVVQVAGSSEEDGDGVKWGAKFADMPVVLEHGDTIDVIVVDRVEATDMLIELAATGKVVNITEKQPSTTAIAMDDGDTDVEESEGGSEVSSTSSVNAAVPSRARLRQTLSHTARRLRLV